MARASPDRGASAAMPAVRTVARDGTPATGSRACAALLALLVSASALASIQSPSDPFPERAASYLLLIEGVPQWGRNPDKPLAPASLTKLMTSLLVLEAARLESVVIVTREASRETGTKLGLRTGEKLRAGDLLAAIVLKSANDACRALADHHAGGEAKFVAAMNERARRMGLRRTHFANACGHDHPGQVSTARELAALAQAVMSHPEYAGLAAKVRLISFGEPEVVAETQK